MRDFLSNFGSTDIGRDILGFGNLYLVYFDCLTVNMKLSSKGSFDEGQHFSHKF